MRYNPGNFREFEDARRQFCREYETDQIWCPHFTWNTVSMGEAEAVMRPECLAKSECLCDKGCPFVQQS